MSGLGLDFARLRPPRPWWAWLLLAAGVLAALATVQDQRAAEQRRDAARQRLQTLQSLAPAARPQRRDPAREAEGAARAHARRALDMPWGELLSTLQRTRPASIALLTLEADALRGSLLLTGEAADYPAMLDYYAVLQEVPGLAEISLAQHGIREDGQARPVRFTLRGRWGTPSAGEAP